MRILECMKAVIDLGINFSSSKTNVQRNVVLQVFTSLSVFSTVARLAEVWLNVSDSVKEELQEILNNRTADDVYSAEVRAPSGSLR